MLSKSLEVGASCTNLFFFEKNLVVSGKVINFAAENINSNNEPIKFILPIDEIFTSRI